MHSLETKRLSLAVKGISLPPKRVPPQKVAPQRLGRFLKLARVEAGLSQGAVAESLGVHEMTISAWERDRQKPNEDAIAQLARLYDTTPRALRYGRQVREEPLEPFTPNPSLKNRLRPVPRARVYEHIQAMVDAGCTIEQIDEAERLMIDGAYNKLNARDPRERTDKEMILDIDDAWDWIKEVLGRAGVKGL